VSRLRAYLAVVKELKTHQSHGGTSWPARVRLAKSFRGMVIIPFQLNDSAQVGRATHIRICVFININYYSALHR
jgi:hypothetical protein